MKYTQVTKICAICKKLFKVYNYRKEIAKYCSRNCCNKATKGKCFNTGRTHFKKGHIPWCKGKKRPEISGRSHCNWKKKIKTTQGYIMVHKFKHPFCDSRGYIREHRFIIEQQIGRYLKPEEIGHHLGKKDDNRPHMLMAFVNKAIHNKFHKNPNYVKPSEIIFDGRSFLKRFLQSF